MRDDFRQELLAMKAEDVRVRGELAARGLLGEGYHPRMEAVHRRNAARLRTMVETAGWPGRSLVGEDGAEAAWRILQHAIGEPDLQRGYLPLLQQAAEQGEIPASQPAYLLDRICFFEGRPQVYGTQYAWNDDGVMTVYEVEEPESVNELRRQVGLPALEESTAGEGPPPVSREKVEEDRREMDAWARAVGWRR